MDGSAFRDFDIGGLFWAVAVCAILVASIPIILVWEGCKYVYRNVDVSVIRVAEEDHE